ncbi:hypothetical protein BSK59_12960 [Paenibacillus odorifer]|uniref:glycosyltransferase n=1 Tax=Paenibacillus odorifer TaxID=189426 RepID=UPI00096C70EF|nr:glycosyltransferase [Paenibacillus odorifer]OME55384.1 hypothetical protein BSK59_12960 [Paenibacillus odorifer]
MEHKNILIACPVRNREWILPAYLEHLHSLKYPKKNLSILWVINQSDDNSEQILKKFQREYSHEYRKITIKIFNGSKIVPNDKRIRATRNRYIYNHLAELRNYILSQVGNNDFIFSSDSDILLKPDTLTQLINSDKDIISSIIFNGYKFDKENAWRYPNILKQLSDGKIEHIANSYVKKSPISKISKLLQVDVTGASVLLSKYAATKIKYGYHIQGEDVAFCLEAKKKGFDIWCDIGLFNQHIMDKEMLVDYKKGVKTNDNTNNGSFNSLE